MGDKDMQHVAIMKKSWGLTDKILSGQKKIESRWYLSSFCPHNIFYCSSGVATGNKMCYK